MGTPTYDPIQTVTLGSPASSVTFSSIPATYTDLVLIISASTPGSDYQLQFNGDTATNYSDTYVGGNGSVATSGRLSTQSSMRLDNFGYLGPVLGSNSFIAHIMNYFNTTTNKTVIARANSNATGLDLVVGLWRSTAAINAILAANSGGNFATGSKFTLFGIRSA